MIDVRTIGHPHSDTESVVGFQTTGEIGHGARADNGIGHGDFDAVSGDLVAAPRPAEALASMECRLVHAHDMGSTHLFVGEVIRYHIDDAILKTDERGHRVVDLEGLDPVGRLGGYDYCRVRDVFEAKAQK